MGIFQQMFASIFLRGLAVFPYAYIHEQYRVIHILNDENHEIPWTHPLWWGKYPQ